MRESKVLLELGPFKGINQSQTAEHTDMGCAVDARNIITDDGALRTTPGTEMLVRMVVVQNFPVLHSIHNVGQRILGVYYKESEGQKGIGVACMYSTSVTPAAGSLLLSADKVTIQHVYSLQGMHQGVHQLLLAVSMLVETGTAKRIVIQTFTERGNNAFTIDQNQGRYMTVYLHRLFTANSGTDMNFISRSGMLEPDNFLSSSDLVTGPAMLVVPDIQDGEIVGLFTAGDSMLIFRKNGVWRGLSTLASMPRFDMTRLDNTLRPVGGENCVLCGGIAYFMTLDGLAYFDGLRAALLPESAHLKNLWPELFPPSGNAYTNAAKMITYRQKIYALFRQPNVIIVFDTQRRTFSVLEGHGATGIARGDGFTGTSSNKEPILTCFDKAALVQMGRGNRFFTGFNGNAATYKPIEAYWETPYIGLPGIEKIKSAKRIYINARGSIMAGANAQQQPAQLRISLYSERNPGVPRQRSIPLANADIPEISTPRMQHRGRMLKMRIENGNGCSFSIPNISVRMRDKEV